MKVQPAKPDVSDKPMSQDENAIHWRRYRWFRNAWWIVWLGTIPVAFPIAVGLTLLFRSEIAFFIVSFSWMGLFAFVSLKMAYVTCPQCGRFLHVSGSYNPFSKSCLHCGHPKWK
jgi:hypothetical protein